MAMLRNGGRPGGQSRSSALWGTGNNDDSRSNALWGKGGRGLVTLMAAVLVLGIPLAASAGGDDNTGPETQTYVSPGMLANASKHPDKTIHVIVTANAGDLPKSRILDKTLGSVDRRLGLIDGIALDLRANRLDQLAKIPGLTITPDAPAHPTGSFSSKQLWATNTGIDKVWNAPVANSTKTQSDLPVPTIAVVDSGVDASKVADFGGRVVQQVNLSTLPNNSPGDGLDNKDKYNIKVANFSLHASNSSSFTHDPLDKAVEKLWFSGVTVVAAAGNYGYANGPSGVKYAPGNDPFVITVGAADMDGNPSPNNDTAPSWSAYGYTNDGFAKPELAADGRYMVGPIPAGSTLASQKASNIVSPGYIMLSGTSFAAPIVAGIAAQIIARNPTWGPDQIKGGLMETARPTPSATPGSLGLGEVNALKAVLLSGAPNPNKAVSWADSLSSADVSWADISWSDSSYEDAAEGDGAGDAAESFADPADLAAAAADPDLQLPSDLVALQPSATTSLP
ncbi:MAG: hypothetical protein E6G25_02330 [Actinobacteria bacterium]|nr:MAG: hypothetical protein E6G25_02330 [Actinomycetota bacterium]